MARKFVVFCTILGLVAFAAAAGTKCRGLALEGGGDKGSYQAGGLKGLIDNLPAEEVAYDVVSGISAGSLNGAVFALYPPGQEKNVTDFLYTLWDTIAKTDVYVDWVPGGVKEGFFEKKGLFNTAPLRTLLDSKVEGKYQERSVYMGTTDMNTGILDVYHNLNITQDWFINAAMSSSAFPFAFPFQVWNNHQYMDGGCVLNLNVFPIIDECRKKGFADEDIVIDAVMCSSSFLKPFDAEGENTLNVVTRLLDIYSYDKNMFYISQAKMSYPKVDFRYFVFPSTKLPDSSIPLHFNHTEILEMYSIGENDALNTIKKGPEAALDDQIQDYQEGIENEANGFVF